MATGGLIVDFFGSKKTPTYPWSIPQASPKTQMKGIPKHKPLVGGLGVCSRGYVEKLLDWRDLCLYNLLLQTNRQGDWRHGFCHSQRQFALPGAKELEMLGPITGFEKEQCVLVEWRIFFNDFCLMFKRFEDLTRIYSQTKALKDEIQCFHLDIWNVDV